MLVHTLRVLYVVPKSLGNFGQNMNGTLHSKWKFIEKSGSPPEVFHFDWTVSKNPVSSYILLRNNTEKFRLKRS